MSDFSDIVAGGALLAVVASAVFYLLRHQAKNRRGIPKHQIPTTLAAGLSLIAFVWFIAWAATDGWVPYGLHAFAASATLAISSLAIGRRRITR